MWHTRLLARLLTAGLLFWTPHALGQLRGARPQLIQVTDRIYSATGYALGNVLFVVTDSSVVVIDTTESPLAAQETLAALRKVTDLPVRYIIYTHFHGDHINGAAGFRQRNGGPLHIIAQDLHNRELAKYQMLRAYNTRLNAVQFGAALPRKEVTLELALDPRRPTIGYLPPTITFDKEYRFEEGGVRFELFHTIGETYDQLMVWLPDERALFPGDLYYASFPMLSSPMKQDRPVLAWAESIERMRELSPEHLVPSHTEPLHGAQQIDETLKNYAAAIRFVHDETVKCINRGLSVGETRQRVRLPEHLARLPYLAERYGRVPWSVNGIYRQYTGWYDLVPAHLNPLPSVELHRALADVFGGVEPLFLAAQRAQESGQNQLALELLTVALDADPTHVSSHLLAARVLDRLAGESINTVQRNVYLVAAQEHRRAADAQGE